MPVLFFVQKSRNFRCTETDYLKQKNNYSMNPPYLVAEMRGSYKDKNVRWPIRARPKKEKDAKQAQLKFLP